MKYALIENGKVKEIVDNKFPFAETSNIYFKKFDENLILVKEGFKFENNTFLPKLTLDELKQELLTQIKREANSRIITSYPEWKQRNYMAAVIDIQNKELIALKAGNTYNPSTDEIATITAAQTAKNQVFAIRTKSDELETSLDSMTQAQLEAFDPTNDNNWN